MSGTYDFFGEIVLDDVANVLAALIDPIVLCDRRDDELHIDADARSTARRNEVVRAITPTVVDMMQPPRPDWRPRMNLILAALEWRARGIEISKLDQSEAGLRERLKKHGISVRDERSLFVMLGLIATQGELLYSMRGDIDPAVGEKMNEILRAFVVALVDHVPDYVR